MTGLKQGMMAKLGTDRVGKGGWVVGAALPKSIIGKRLYPSKYLVTACKDGEIDIMKIEGCPRSVLGSVEGHRSWTNWNTVVGQLCPYR